MPWRSWSGPPAYWDTADSATPWVDLGQVGRGRSTNRPALVALGADTTRSEPDLLRPGFGDDLHAAVTGGTVGGLWSINLSRTMLLAHLESTGGALGWCSEYRGSRTMAQCDVTPPSVPVEELPVATEAGFGTLALPDWLQRAVIARTQTFARDAGPYVTWVHAQRFQGADAWLGPHINVNHLTDYLTWCHEMGHRTLSTLGVWNRGEAQANPDLLRDLVGDAATSEARALFSEECGTARCPADVAPSGRCRGFVTGDPYERDTQHSAIYVLEAYLSDGDALRLAIYDDLRAGSDLLQRKYRWLRSYVFGGVEYRDHLEPLVVVRLTNKHSGKVLDVTGWDLDASALVQQYSSHGGDNQRFALVPQGGGRYLLRAMHSGLCLEVAGGSTQDAAGVWQSQEHAGAQKLFSLVVDTQGYVELVAAHSGHCLEVAGWATGDGAPVQQYHRHGGDNQKWRLTPRGPW